VRHDCDREIGETAQDAVNALTTAGAANGRFHRCLGEAV